MRATHKNRQSGVSLVELMVVVAIVIIVVSSTVGLFGPMLRRNDLMNQMRYVKAAFLKAKSNALEYTAPVRFTLDTDDNSILIIRDGDRDGNFSDEPVIVFGSMVDDAPVGAASPYTSRVMSDPDKGNEELPVWFQADMFSGALVDVFPDSGFVIMPNGRVHDYNLNPTGGTFFFKDWYGDEDDPNSDLWGAVHITAMGEVRMALLKDGQQGSGTFNGWTWMEK